MKESYTYALWNLIAKDFRIRYRNMSLGFLWSILNPLVMLGVLVVVFGLIYPNQSIKHFPVFLLLGLVPYNFLAQCLSTGTGCLVENVSFLKRMRFPSILLPISVVLSCCIHLAIQCVLLAALALYHGLPPSINLLWLLPSLGILLVFLTGAVMICCCLDVFFRDMQYLVQSVVLVLFWFTPIFYPLALARGNLPPLAAQFYTANPLVGCIETARLAVLEQAPPDVHSLVMALVVATATFLVGVLLFRRLSRKLPDYL